MDRSLMSLWGESVPSGLTFTAGLVAHLPELARRYLHHAIDDGAPIARAVRLRMHGEIRLKEWSAFTAEQVIAYPKGLVWSARTRIGLPVSGYDRLLGNRGEMNWRLLGLVPVMRAKGPDVSRSAAGRMAGELCWLPTALLSEGIRWGDAVGDWQPLSVSTPVGEVDLSLRIDADGRLLACRISRWGNPNGHYGLTPFGVEMHEERRFGPYTVPSQISAGWNFPEDSTQEFFRAEIDDAEYR